MSPSMSIAKTRSGSGPEYIAPAPTSEAMVEQLVFLIDHDKSCKNVGEGCRNCQRYREMERVLMATWTEPTPPKTENPS